MGQVVEIVRFRVDRETELAFVEGRRDVDVALARFTGFLGSELTRGDAQLWTLMVRWRSRADAEAAQSVTLGAKGLPELNAWRALAREFLSFETVDSVLSLGPLPEDDSALNREIALRFAKDGLGKADLTVFDELLSADITVTTALSPRQPIYGLNAYKTVFRQFAEAWPVSRFDIEECICCGENVVIRFTAIACFRKDYYGIKANNLEVPLKEIQIYTVRQGKIVESVVGAINLPFEFTMYPVLKDAVFDGLTIAG